MSCILTADCNITEDSPGVLYPVALTVNVSMQHSPQEQKHSQCFLYLLVPPYILLFSLLFTFSILVDTLYLPQPAYELRVINQ